MKALVQRVLRGSVTIDDRIVGSIGRGFVILVGAGVGDTEDHARQLAHKTVNLRVFPDEKGRMNLSIQDTGGEILVVPQFTLYADTTKGNRPSFVRAASPELAENLYSSYVDALRRTIDQSRVATGVFRSAMTVEIVNDGPVTIELTVEPRGDDAT
jgi:D-tyrosyl-tRNA(Tyr) deacylase